VWGSLEVSRVAHCLKERLNVKGYTTTVSTKLLSGTEVLISP